MKVPTVVWLPLVVMFCILLLYQTILEVAGSQHAKEQSIRRYFLFGGLALIYLGMVMLYYAPHGGVKIRSETASRIYGGFILLFGIVIFVRSFIARAGELRHDFERATSDRQVIVDPDLYVSPRDRVMGVDRERENGGRKPWE